MAKTPKHMIRKFSYKEAYSILHSLIVNHKMTSETYLLISLWLTGMLSKIQFSYLKTITKNNINNLDFNSNTDEYKEFVHDVIYEMIYFKVDESGEKKGLVTKVSWDRIPIINKETKQIIRYEPLEGNEGKVVAFIKQAFIHCVYKCLSKGYRGGITYSSLYCTRKSKDSQLDALRERMVNETDTSITTVELIEKLKLEGFTDTTIFQYRYIYSLGNLKTYTELTDEILLKASVETTVRHLSSVDNYKKDLYEGVFNILNSNLLPKVNREFLKAFYKIPSRVDYRGQVKFFESDFVLFFEQFPEYKQVLKVKRLSYAGGRRVISYADKGYTYAESSIYKESLKMMKIALTPLLINLKDKYEMQAQEVANIQRDFSDSINLKEGEGFYDSYFETFGI